MDATSGRKRFLSKLSAGMAIAAATLVGAYAVASVSASSAAATFSSAELTSRTRLDAFTAAVSRASIEQEDARARCKVLKGARKSGCHALAREEEKRAVDKARERWSSAL